MHCDSSFSKVLSLDFEFVCGGLSIKTVLPRAAAGPGEKGREVGGPQVEN